jgi:hypothetical protein
VLRSLSGTMAISETSLKDLVMMAVNAPSFYSAWISLWLL